MTGVLDHRGNPVSPDPDLPIDPKMCLDCEEMMKELMGGVLVCVNPDCPKNHGD